MSEAKKRPLTTLTNQDDTHTTTKKKLFRFRQVVPPPPITATMQRLEKLLDGKPPQISRKPKRAAPQTPTVIAPVLGRQLGVPASAIPQNAFAFRGGLSCAPTFKKASILPKVPKVEKGRTSALSILDELDSKTDRSTMQQAIPTTKSSTTTRKGEGRPKVNDQTSTLTFSSKETTEIQEEESRNREVWIDKRTNTDAATLGRPSGPPVAPSHSSVEPSTISTQSASSLKIGLQMGTSKTAPYKRSSVMSRSCAPSEPTAVATSPGVQEIDGLLPSNTEEPTMPYLSSIQELPPPKSGAADDNDDDDNDNDRTELWVAKPLKQTNLPGSSKSETSQEPTSSTAINKRPRSNDNFVRLNLRNSAGACRGARNKKLRRKSRYNNYKNQQYLNKDESDDETGAAKPLLGSSHGQAYVSRMTGLDPMDDYLDGVYTGSKTKKAKAPAKKLGPSSNTEQDHDSIPVCARHDRPCKLVVVKKNTKGNKGRKFYACSMPRGEQCDHFEWAEDTIEAARKVVQGNSSHSSFVARQVEAHVARFRNLTIPELRVEATQRRLNKQGKKSQLLLRLALWARDEITKAVPYPDDEEHVGIQAESRKGDVTTASGDSVAEILVLDDSDSSSSSESTDDELEFVDDNRVPEDMSIECDKSVEIAKPGEMQSKLVSTLKSVFGYSGFRDGQEWAIQRCLAGKRSLLVAPTGSGKSLCYSLPAALMDGVCVVVSPLISLIQDQLRSLPPRVPAATLSGSISASATAAIIDDVIRKRIKILFVSPERLTSPSFRRLFNTTWNADTQQYERRFPMISLLCVDEAHCVSQWAHNFRPCFLRFKRLLQLMEPQSVLAVTATAGPRVINDIASTLGIDAAAEREDVGDDKNVLIIDKARDNIEVSCQFVETHEERLDMLSKVLKSKSPDKSSKENKFAGVLASGSVIVYVWRQRDTEVVAENLAAAGVKGGVVIYHGGMDASSRTKAQSKFMRGKARICVATVAFGMGIDKADVEGIIHLNLSSSPEHYLQEIGRAGRDGRQARAISFPTLEEIPVRHSLTHSNFISKSQIRSLLFAMRKIVLENNSQHGRRSLNIALPVERLMIECDLKVETIETLLSILEQDGGDNPLLHVEGFNYDSATVALKKRTIEKLAEKEPLAACIKRVGVCCEQPIGEEREDTPWSRRPDSLTFPRHFLAYSKGSYAFSVAKCANALGPEAESRHVFAALRRLQSSGELELSLDTSVKGRVFMLTTSVNGLEFFCAEDFDRKADDLTSLLHESFTSSITSGARKVLDINFILNDIYQTQGDKGEPLVLGPGRSTLRFQELMSRYFGQGLPHDKGVLTNLPDSFSTVRRRELENDLHSILRDLPVLITQAPDESDHSPVLGDSKFPDYTAVTATKFFHGLDSPRAPSKAFQSHPLFGKWRQAQFCVVLGAVVELLKHPAGNSGKENFVSK